MPDCIEPRCHRQTKPKRGRGRKPVRCEPHRQAARRESQRAYAARTRARHTGGAMPKCQSIIKSIIGRPYRCNEPTKTPTTRGRPPRHCPECRDFRRYRAAYKRWQRTIQKGEEKRERRAARRQAAIENIRRIAGQDKPRLFAAGLYDGLNYRGVRRYGTNQDYVRGLRAAVICWRFDRNPPKTAANLVGRYPHHFHPEVVARFSTDRLTTTTGPAANAGTEATHRPAEAK